MGQFSVRLPESLHQSLKSWADAEGVSLNQLISVALAEKWTEQRQSNRLLELAGREPLSREEYLTLLRKAPNTLPENPLDRFPEK